MRERQIHSPAIRRFKGPYRICRDRLIVLAEYNGYFGGRRPLELSAMSPQWNISVGRVTQVYQFCSSLDTNKCEVNNSQEQRFLFHARLRSVLAYDCNWKRPIDARQAEENSWRGK